MSGKDRRDSPGDAARALFARGDYKRAAYALLPAARKRELPTEDFRLLAECYLRLENPAEALTWLDALPVKGPDDLDLAGRCLLALKNWKEADIRFVAALKAGGDASPALGRADAMLRGRDFASLAAADRKRYVDLLAAATQLANCPYRAFETLADIAHGESDLARVIAALQAAVAAHPDLTAPRVRLAALLLEKRKDAPAALQTLRPVALSVVGDTVDPETLWVAFRAARESDNQRAVLTIAERLRPFFATHGVGPDKLIADAHMRLGERGYALHRYESEIRRPDQTARLVGLFGRTETLMDTGTPDEILATARLALGAWLVSWTDGTDLEWLHPGGGTVAIRLPVAPDAADGDAKPVEIRHPYPFADDIERVCRRIAALDIALPEPEIKARASCLLYYFYNRPDSPEGNQWLDIAATLEHPRLGDELAKRQIREGNLESALASLVDHIVWLGGLQDGLARIDRVLAELAPGIHALIEPLKPVERLEIHQNLLARLDARRDSGTARRVFLPLYRALWRDLLTAPGLEDSLLQLISRLISDAPDDNGLLLDRADTLARCGLHESAERVYRDLLKRDPNLAAGHRGLSSVLEKRRSLKAALEHSTEAIKLSPESETVSRHEVLRAKLAEEETAGPDHPDLLKSAPYRWRLLVPSERTLLGVLNAISGFRDWAHLARLAGLPADSIPGQWQRLVDLGMITWSANSRAFEINDNIRTLLIADHPAPVLGKVIAGGTDTAVKCVFSSTLEADTYRALVEVFPNHLVMPDVALATVFDYQVMQTLLTPVDFTYFRQARVDFCVVSTTNYVPFLAIETDSHYHDKSAGVERDRTKDTIFQIGGLPLLRFRPVGNRDAAVIRDQLQEMVRGLRDELRGQIARSGFHNSRSSLRHLAPEDAE